MSSCSRERGGKKPLVGKGPKSAERVEAQQHSYRRPSSRQQSSMAEQSFHSATVPEDNRITALKCGGSKVTPKNMMIQRERIDSLGKVGWHHRPQGLYPLLLQQHVHPIASCYIS